jgi:SpoVK/Ycf46/Vps4 family AAA+-type ATPase
MQTVAAEAKAAVFEVTPASVTGAYLGESERRLREVFENAAAAAQRGGTPLVFIDEIDTLCPKRGQHSAHGARVVTQLLTLLDGAAGSNEGNVRCGTVHLSLVLLQGAQLQTLLCPWQGRHHELSICLAG